jgi:hypothetical protein
VIANVNHKNFRKHIGEFGTVPIPTSHQTLLGVIIVGAREKVPKGQLGVPNLFGRVLFDRDATERSIILDGNSAGPTVNGNLDRLDLIWVRRIAINRIDQNLIKNFQERG